jgi:hypothetical protein
MTNPYTDPECDPPADFSLVESRKYEEAIIELLKGGRGIAAELSLEGQRPDTVLVFRFADPKNPASILESRMRLWTPDGGPSYVSPVDGKRYIESAVWAASNIGHQFLAGEFVRNATPTQEGVRPETRPGSGSDD